MDAVEFIKEFRRFCSQRSCENCQFYSEFEECALTPTSSENELPDAESIALLIEDWARLFPRKTIMQDFFEKFPNAPKAKSGEPMTCPYNCGYGNFCCEQSNGICFNCWSRPLEES